MQDAGNKKNRKARWFLSLFIISIILVFGIWRFLLFFQPISETLFGRFLHETAKKYFHIEILTRKNKPLPPLPQKTERAPASGWTLEDFDGEKMDYAFWLREGCGEYNVDDDDTPETRPLVNNALLWLAFEDEEAKKHYHDLLLLLYTENFHWIENGERRLAAVIESYLAMRDAGTFTLQEQEELEKWFKNLAYKMRGRDEGKWANFMNHLRSPGSEKQGVSAGLNAVTGYVLATTKTDVDYSRDVQDMWRFALTARTFDDTWAPAENSVHYAAYIMASMLRVAIYTNYGEMLQDKSVLANLKKGMDWIMSIMPHNGFVPAFGTTWFHDHVFPYVDILHAGAYYLQDGRYKWMAAKMFEYGFTHNPAERVEVNPLWIWKYVDDSLPAIQPTVEDYGSVAVYRPLAHGYDTAWDSNIPERKFDKLILRDSWEQDGLYFQIEVAPSSAKNQPYANSITNIVYGDEPFSSDVTFDAFHNTWTARNVVEPVRSKTDATFEYLHDFGSYVVSKTSARGWDRYIGMVKESHAVVFDYNTSPGTAYWHLQGEPAWHDDFVELKKGEYQLHAYFPHHNWYTVQQFDDHNWNASDKHDRYWYVGSPSRELQIQSPGTWAMLFYPFRKERPVITAITPQLDGANVYPEAIGIKSEHSSYTDWHGTSRIEKEILYDIIQTDAEIFWARETQKDFCICFVNAECIKILMKHIPSEVFFHGKPDPKWEYAESTGIVTIFPSQSQGTVTIVK